MKSAEIAKNQDQDVVWVLLQEAEDTTAIPQALADWLMASSREHPTALEALRNALGQNLSCAAAYQSKKRLARSLIAAVGGAEVKDGLGYCALEYLEMTCPAVELERRAIEYARLVMAIGSADSAASTGDPITAPQAAINRTDCL